MNEDRKFIVPGEETDTPVSSKDFAYWKVKCVCGEVHDRTVTMYWNDGDERVTEHHCFICPEHGLHMQIEKNPPFRILKTIQYRPTVERVPPSELDGDALAAYFE